MRKNLLKNDGFPYSVDVEKDLTPMQEANTGDSWYIKAEFEAAGTQYGFTWHEGLLSANGTTLVSAEALFMSVKDDLYLNYDMTRPFAGKNGVDYETLHVYSEWGALRGDSREMALDLCVEDNEMHVTLTYNDEVLMNGVTGLIEAGNTSSYQYAFPNMKMNGYMVLRGQRIEIRNQYAWFDRQYGLINGKKGAPLFLVGKSSWLWIGISRLSGEKGAISLWDVYNPGHRNAYATVVRPDGSHANLPIDVTYDDVWISEISGFSYPRKIHVSIPAEQFTADFTCCTNGKSYHFLRQPKELSGCQCLYYMEGSYKGQPFARVNDVEMIGDLCGEA